MRYLLFLLISIMSACALCSSVDENGTQIDFPSNWTGNTWLPPQGTSLFSTNEMRTLFQNECTLFVGDSLQRRVGDTLFSLLANTTDKYINSKQRDRGRKERSVPQLQQQLVNNTNSTLTGCLDFEWRPMLADLQNFTKEYVDKPLYSKYTMVVIASTIWDVAGSNKPRYHPNAASLRVTVNKTIDSLAHLATMKPNVSFVWKTSGWCHNCKWGSPEARGATNYKVYAANEQAIQSIKSERLDNLKVIDWATHVYPRSIGDSRILSGDNNPYHYGLEPRLVFIQLLSDMIDSLLSSDSTAAPKKLTIESHLPFYIYLVQGTCAALLCVVIVARSFGRKTAAGRKLRHLLKSWVAIGQKRFVTADVASSPPTAHNSVCTEKRRQAHDGEEPQDDLNERLRRASTVPVSKE
jgi:hypothetical protein